MRPDLKVLFASGYTDDIIVHSGIAEASFNFIGKPYTLPSLARRIRDVLAGRGAAS